MQEIVAMVRANMVAATKNALSKAGCLILMHQVPGVRGKKGMDPATLRMVMESGELPRTPGGRIPDRSGQADTQAVVQYLRSR